MSVQRSIHFTLISLDFRFLCQSSIKVLVTDIYSVISESFMNLKCVLVGAGVWNGVGRQRKLI